MRHAKKGTRPERGKRKLASGGADARRVLYAESHESSVGVGGGKHGYDTIGLLNSYRNTAVGVDFTRMCKLSTYLVGQIRSCIILLPDPFVLKETKGLQ